MIEHVQPFKQLFDRDQPLWHTPLVPHGADWIPIFLSLGVFANYLASHRSALQASQAWSLGGIVLLLLALDRWAAWHYRTLPPLRTQVVLFALRCVLLEAAVQIEGFELSAFLYLILPFTALLSFGVLTGYVVGGLTWAVFVLKLFWADSTLGSSLEGLLIFAMGVLFILVLSQIGAQERAARMQVEHVLGALQHAHQDLAESHRQLARYATQAADLATSAERNRLAREIHDGLSHYLTGIAVQLEKALAFRAQDAQEADHAVRTSKHLVDQALDDVRCSVGLLREHYAPFVLQRRCRN